MAASTRSADMVARDRIVVAGCPKQARFGQYR
jgi:hypothetical protein